MSILDISKALIYKFWYDYVRPKYGERAKLCYTDSDTLLLILYLKIFLENISYDSEKWFDMSNYNKKDKIPLPIRKNKKLAGLFKDKLGGKITTEFVALIPKAY